MHFIGLNLLVGERMTELFSIVAQADGFAWKLQCFGVIVSLLGLAAYCLGYVLAVRKPPKRSVSVPGLLYGLGIFASLTWYVMPFLPQPRIPGVLALYSRADDLTVWLGAAAQVYGIVFGIRYFLFTSRATLLNLSVTRQNVFKPERLLTTGVYAECRHPMLMGDAIAHLTIAMALTGALTILLFPIYYLINEAFVEIQERLVLRRRFGDAYRDYAKRTPRMMSFKLGAIFLVGVAFSASALAFVKQ